MKRGIIFLLVVGLLFAGLIGVVSGANVNYAPDGTASETGTTKGTSSGAVANTNDGSYTTYWERYGYDGSPGDGDTVYGQFTIEIAFAATIPNLEKIKYWVGWHNSVEKEKMSYGRTLSCEIKQAGNWMQVGTNTSSPVEIEGPWYDVTHVKIYMSTWTRCHTSYFSCGSMNARARLYEIEAWGPEPCTPILTCADYPGQCGVGLNDGCEDVLDCSDNCDSGEICQEGFCIIETEITRAYWANMKNEELIEGEEPDNQVDLNDRVKLMVGGEGMEDREITYTIIKSGFPSWNPRNWFPRKVAETNTIGFTTWRAEEEGTYYFKAEIEGITETQQSGDLVVSDEEVNSPPHVEILSPKKGEIYYTNDVIDFTSNIYDEDDEINSVLWDLGDGNTNSELDFTHSYSSTGQKTITLTATDERGLVSEDKTSVLIIDPSVGADAEYVFAYIDNPKDGGSYGKVVDFDASSSFAIETTNCGGTSCTINCLGGDCPLETEGGQGINNGNRGDYSDLEFTWDFDDGRSKNGMGLKNLDGWVFRVAGAHKTWLNVSVNPFSLTEVEFNSFFEDPYCYRDKSTGKTYWYEDWNIIPSSDDCYREDGKPRAYCCPPGYACNVGTGDCEELEGIASCGQFKTQDACEKSSVFTAEDELNPILEKKGYKCGPEYSEKYGENCWKIIECKCKWGSCLAVAEHWVCNATKCWNFEDLEDPLFEEEIKEICDTDEPLLSIGECSFVFTLEDRCEEEGVIKRNWDATWIPPEKAAESPAYCVDGSDQIQCKVAKLVFWGIAGLITAILVIVIIYWFIIKKEKKKGKRK